INDAKQSVAQKNRDGSIGEAIAFKDERIQVSSAEADAKIGEASASAKSIDGENDAKIKIAQSNAERRQKEAESLRLATASEKIQAAKALEEAYVAEKEAEIARAEREMATKKADEIVQAEIAKQKLVIEAQAKAEQTIAVAKGDADAIFLRQEAQAKGLYEVLTKQAEGFQRIVEAAGGNNRDAVLMMIADKLPELVRTQVDAIKNMKIDKVTVWENGNGGDNTSTSKFVSSLYKSIPPLNDLFNMAGMDLPAYLGKVQSQENGKKDDKDPAVLNEASEAPKDKPAKK
ncbi:MAG: flotillin family protein, partial [Saprospiraceae bacterium]|nr:flotillin family protein [Saprospiraceae bacterium]